MCKFFLWACVIFSCFSCGGTRTASLYQEDRFRISRLDDLYRFLTYRDDRYPLVSAHRGGPAPGYPENAIETFARSASRQALIIECDIAMSRDSVLVLMHDDELGRTSNGKGMLKTHTLDQLKALRLRDGSGTLTTFTIPTLDEVLAWGKGKVLFTLDVKRGVPYQKVIDAVRRNAAESYSVLITYNAGQAAEVHRLAPNLLISASIGSADDLDRLNEYGVPDNRLLAFVGTSEPDMAVYQLLHDHGILCILGTMGNLDKQAAARGEELYYDLVGRGADILSTDRVPQAEQQLQQFRKDKKIKSAFLND